MSIEVSPEYGGAGANFFSAILAIEELAKVDPSVSVFCDVQNTLVLEMFHKYANKELRQKYLPKLCKNLVRINSTLWIFKFSCIFQYLNIPVYLINSHGYLVSVIW